MNWWALLVLIFVALGVWFFNRRRSKRIKKIIYKINGDVTKKESIVMTVSDEAIDFQKKALSWFYSDFISRALDIAKNEGKKHVDLEIMERAFLDIMNNKPPPRPRSTSPQTP